METAALMPETRARLTLDPGHVAAFERDGYVVVPGLFAEAEMARISAWTDALVALPEVRGRHMVYYEDSLTEPGVRVRQRIEDYCRFHAGFDRLLNGPDVLACVGRLFGEPAVMFKDKINFKMPGGDGFKAHQDVQAGWSDYAALHITLLISIDDATPENGCLEMAPGRHREGLLGEEWKPLDDDAADYVPCPTRRGDVVLFDSFAPHRSGPNRTGSQRRVLYVTYNRASEGDSRARYYADKRRSFPPDCEREPGKSYVFRV